MKRIISLVLAVIMVLGVATAFAATVTNATTHTYDVYQVFSGTQAESGSELGDIEWGEGINSSAFLSALKADARFNVTKTVDEIETTENAFKNSTTAKDVAEVLGDYSDDSSFAKAFANVADQNKSSTKTASVTGNAVTPDLTAGYYLFVDTQKIGADGNDALNTALLQITNKSTGLEIKKKYDVPSLDKDITKVNDTEVEIEATDANIGDTVEYSLKGTLPENFDDYETYKYIFHDTLSKGQAIAAGAIKVYLVNGTTETDVTEKFTITPDTAVDGTAETTTITVANNNIKGGTTALAGVTATSKIVVKYTVTITKDAVVGSAGNPNKAKLEYSNNPNGTGDGTTNTPEDTVVVFTYELDSTKVDNDDTTVKLAGAQFVLKATSGDHANKWVQIDVATGKITGWLDTEPTSLATIPTEGNTGVLVSADSTGLFKVIGLDAGTYELKEIKAPQGYNLPANNTTTINITATIKGSETETHDDVTPELEELKLNNVVGNKTTGILTEEITNDKGTTLPSTGGIGTTIFYVLGSVMALGALVLLVTKRRVNVQ